MNTQASPSVEQHVRKVLTLSHSVCLAIVLLSGVGFIFWEQWNARGETAAMAAVNDLRTISTSTQRILLQAIRQNQAPGDERVRLITECKKSLADLKNIHPAQQESEEGNRLRQELASKLDRFVRRIDAVLEMRTGTALSRDDYESFYLLTSELTGQIDKISDYETQNAKLRIEKHRTLNWIFLGVFLTLTIAAFFFVFRPLTQKLSNEVRTLEQTKKALLEKKTSAEVVTTAWSLFVCHAGQRIRKAVNDIVQRSTVLEDNLFTKSSGENADYAAWIRERGTQILGVVNDTLNLAFIESGLTPLMPRAVNLTQLVRDMTAYLKPAAENRGLVYTVNLPPQDVWVMGDTDQIWRLIEKIFDNAIKYTQHGEVSITVSVLPDGHVTVAVRDTGCGIPAEALPRIFDPQPYEEESETSLEQGLGINLSVAQQLANYMGSVISVHSEVDKGTTFLIDMPACTPEGQLLVSSSQFRMRSL